jgi:hypothetical protein
MANGSINGFDGLGKAFRCDVFSLWKRSFVGKQKICKNALGVKGFYDGPELSC